MLTQEVHSAWHNLFFNLLPEEVVHLIPIIGLETEKRIESWKLVFGNRTREQAIELVKREWTPRSVTNHVAGESGWRRHVK
jgi:hypothetical protein